MSERQLPVVLLANWAQPRDTIFTPDTLHALRTRFALIEIPDDSRGGELDKHLPEAFAIVGQPDLPAERLRRATKLKAVLNVEGNFLPNVDYETCFQRRLSRKGGSVRDVSENAGMAWNFIESGGEQGFLLPPDVRDWLPADQLAWFVIDAVAQMDLSAFYAAYRADGHGRAAYEPSMMVTLVLHAFATRVRSSRAIESHCRQDVAYRVITGNVVSDHATIARFVVRHEQALADLFGEVLRLCGEAGLAKPEVIAIDGTRMAGSANSDATRDFGQSAREIVAEHKATDEAEDELYGDARGDELPEQLQTAEGRREFLRKAREKLRDEQTEDRERAGEGLPEPEFAFDEQRIVARTQGREGWLREARRQLEQHRWQQPDPIFRSRTDRLLLAADRLEVELAAEGCGNEAYEQFKERSRAAGGHRVGGPPKPYQPPQVPDGKVNLTDPDSKRLKAREGYVQGYNAQAVVDEGQIVLAAEITNSNVDWSQLDPMVTATIAQLVRAGIAARPETALADAQY